MEDITNGKLKNTYKQKKGEKPPFALMLLLRGRTN